MESSTIIMVILSIVFLIILTIVQFTIIIKMINTTKIVRDVINESEIPVNIQGDGIKLISLIAKTLIDQVYFRTNESVKDSEKVGANEDI